MAALRVRECLQALRRAGGVEGRRPRNRQRRVRRPRRPVRLRQIDVARHHRRTGNAKRRRDRNRRPADERRAAKDRNIAMVFQSYALYPSMTVRQNITFGMECRRVPKARSSRGGRRVARLLQIEPLLDRRPAQLSGGQRQRVAMGRALVRDPRCSCSTSRCPTSTPSCGSKCAWRSSGCTSAWARPSSTSRTIRSRP